MSGPLTSCLHVVFRLPRFQPGLLRTLWQCAEEPLFVPGSVGVLFRLRLGFRLPLGDLTMRYGAGWHGPCYGARCKFPASWRVCENIQWTSSWSPLAVETATVGVKCWHAGFVHGEVPHARRGVMGRGGRVAPVFSMHDEWPSGVST
jgi:hypothetical protein